MQMGYSCRSLEQPLLPVVSALLAEDHVDDLAVLCALPSEVELVQGQVREVLLGLSRGGGTQTLCLCIQESGDAHEHSSTAAQKNASNTVDDSLAGKRVQIIR